MTHDEPIEPGIRPLVEELNRTGIVQTFSSCEGHYDDPADAPGRNRHRAEVRFLPAPGQTEAIIETWLSRLLVRFRAKHGLIPIQLIGYKLFTPTGDGLLDTTFVLELRPFLARDPPAVQRADTDRAVQQLVIILNAGR
jgi:hypothetical protein